MTLQPYNPINRKALNLAQCNVALEGTYIEFDLDRSMAM